MSAGFLTRITGKRQKLPQTFRNSSCKRGVFWYFGIWGAFWASTQGTLKGTDLRGQTSRLRFSQKAARLALLERKQVSKCTLVPVFCTVVPFFYLRSGFGVRRSVFCTLVPGFGGCREHPPKPPFLETTFCEPPTFV